MDDDTIVEIANIAADKEAGFEMEPDTFLKLVKTGHVKATWHTHPDTDSNLSGEDHDGFMGWPDLEHIIIAADGIARYRIVDGLVIRCD